LVDMLGPAGLGGRGGEDSVEVRSGKSANGTCSGAIRDFDVE
jgi:hypothetical protein